MLQAVEGIYRDGKVELLEQPAGVTEARVIVTFLPAEGGKSPLTPEEVIELRWRLEAAAQDWDRPDMDVYNDMGSGGGIPMLKAVEGIYRDGEVELLEQPGGVTEARVIVTFLPAEGPIDLRTLGISEEQAAAMRHRFGAATEDWDRPDMDVYNDL